MSLKYRFILLAGLLVCNAGRADNLENSTHSLTVGEDLRLEIRSKQSGRTFQFEPRFVVYRVSEDPDLALRSANLTVSYNVPTWRIAEEVEAESTFVARERQVAQQGDGFDDRILSADAAAERTADAFAAGVPTTVLPKGATVTGQSVLFEFPQFPEFHFEARIDLPESGYPELTFSLLPKSGGFYSVAYTGAPSHAVERVDEIWQSLIWTEMRFPDQSYLTLAFRCPLPTTFAQVDGHTLGVLADPAEFPFEPLPMFDNSRFGVAIRNPSGEAQPVLFAPVLGGHGSRMEPGSRFDFKVQLVVEKNSITGTYANIAQQVFGFTDYRNNALGSLNDVLDRMIDYGMSEYANFISSLKGCSYSTDVPDAVKNVSSLNPLNIALLRDSEEIFAERAYPMIEYLLSREKFLFTLDAEQKIQSPSRRMAGPAAPLSELTSLFSISQQSNAVYLELAKQLYGVDRVLNLDTVIKGDRWQNSLAIYQATGDTEYLERAKRNADEYIRLNSDTPRATFGDDPFFWTAFVPDFSNLIELYEATGEERYLEAAHQSARRFCLFVWMSPAIPEQPVLVNEGDEAPVYWYLKRKREEPMDIPEEWVPAWRLSEIGLTPESTGTSNGHRAIFMANFAPWLLRISEYTGDSFLEQVARSAVVGRYRNFPGYHINTARTTIYEKADYPLRHHNELNVNSFHYNHIWPQISFLFDFLVTEAWKRSDRAISFPSAYIEGYAYLQNKFYGHQKGNFYDYDDAVLWMPKGLFSSSSGQLNGLSARGENRAYFAFTNQADYPVESTITFNRELLNATAGELPVEVLINNERVSTGMLSGNELVLLLPPKGIAAVILGDVNPRASFQKSILALDNRSAWKNDYYESAFGGARAMILNWGQKRTNAFVYLQADDSVYSEVSLHLEDGTVLVDDAYPYEFTVPITSESDRFSFSLSATSLDGTGSKSETITLSKEAQ